MADDTRTLNTEPSTPAAMDAPRPVARGDRVDAIDALRGLAIMGILVVNIVTFAWPSAAMSLPGLMGEGVWNDIGFVSGDLFFMGKFMFLFALLFGASVYFFDRKTRPLDAEPSVKDGTGLWLRRQGVLLGFGLLHAAVLWYGDILAPYAVVGFVVVWWLRRLKPETQIGLGVGLHLFGTLLLVAVFFGLASIMDDETIKQTFDQEVDAHTGSYLGLMLYRVMMTAVFWLVLGPIFSLQVGGIMLGGVALCRMGILTGERSAAWYRRAALVLVPAGLLVSVGVYFALPVVLGPQTAAYVWDGLAQFVGIPQALGYAAVVFWAVKAGALRFVTGALAIVGRMALTNYLMQSLLCAIIFYGWGFGNYAQVDYPALFAVIVGIWVINFVFSAAWLSVFRMGPMEWLWRSLTYWKLQPLRKAGA